MTEISELVNVPREITINNNTLKVRQLKIKELFGYFEEKIRNKKIKEAQEIASLMEGEDKKGFLIDVWKNLPSGTELTEMVTDAMASVDGITSMIYLGAKDYDSTLTEEKVKDMIDLNNLDELAGVITWLAGNNSTEENKKKRGKKEKK